MMRTIDTLIIHCADTPDGAAFDIEDVDAWHAARGFARDAKARLAHRPELKAVGYHEVITVDGRRQIGRHSDEQGAHARGHNATSIGVCLIGRERFTRAQWNSLFACVVELTARHPGMKIIGHRDVDNGKTCPGFDVREWIARGHDPEETNIIEV